MADKKRFSSHVDSHTYPSLIFKNLKIFNIGYKLKEKKNEKYVVSNVEAYKKIIDKIMDKKVGRIECFFSKIIPKNIPFKFQIFDEIITNTKSYNRESLHTFETEKKKILLMTNTKNDSPALMYFSIKKTMIALLLLLDRFLQI